MYYHASPLGNISRLEPRISNHGIPLIYFSKKRENVLVYLSNAVEKYCRETGFAFDGTWQKWGPYGFDKDCRLCLEEYYPNALEETYSGVSGYIYSVSEIEDSGFGLQIPDAATSSAPVDVSNPEFVADAYNEILEAEKQGLITIIRYDEQTDKKKDWIARTIKQEYEDAENHSEYRYFLEAKFNGVVDFGKNIEVKENEIGRDKICRKPG